MALSVTVAKPKGKLKVTVAKPKGKLKVTTNKGMQSGYNPQRSTYNPQRTVSSSRVQGTKPRLQGGSASYVQRTATAAQVRAAAAAKRLAVQKEIARQKEIRRKQVQGKLDRKVLSKSAELKLSIKQNPFFGDISIGRNYAPGNISVPKYEESEYERMKREAKEKAMSLVDMQGTTSPWGSLFDKVSGGLASQQHRRNYAKQQAQVFADRQINSYEQRLDAHNKLQARLKADYASKQKTLSPTQLNRLATEYNRQMQTSLSNLNRVAAYTEGTLEGLGIKAEEALKGKVGAAATWFGKNVIEKAAQNPLWKYSLGEGDRDYPSFATIPSRLVNFVGNLNTKDRQIHKYGGETTNRVNSRDNAWQATFNQRNFNVRPWVDITPQQAPEHLKNDVISLINARKSAGVKDPDKLNYDKVLADRVSSYNKLQKRRNTGLEFAVDPSNILMGAGAAVKGARSLGYLDKLTEAAKASKTFNWAFRAAESVTSAKKYFAEAAQELKADKHLGWFFKEAKSPAEKLDDAISMVRAAQADFHKKVLPRIKQIDRKIFKGRVDFSVFDDISKLTESEARIFQRMRSGKLSARDRLLLAGQNYKPIRDKLEGIVTKWQKFSDELATADDVFKKKDYIPNTSWTNGDRAQYDFRLRQKSKKIQSKEELEQSVVDRYLLSDFGRNAKTNRTALKLERERLVSDYTGFMNEQRSKVESAYRKTRSPVNRVRGVLGAPMRAWKKSVLKYRPAWTVNNVLYNTQAGVLSGGLDFLPEQLKMLNSRYARGVTDAVPEGIKGTLAKEIGSKGRLNKFYNSVENKARIAAYQALIKKGMSPEKALKRVNKYFFDYTTKNWERPIKTVVPFWAWTKSLSKAAVRMPLDHPLGAQIYNRIGRHQKEEFGRQFDQKDAPELKKLGYSDEEIQKIKAQQEKMYSGRLRIGNKYYTTPFNAFSQNGLSQLGLNPFLAAALESITSKDQYGRPVGGSDASLLSRLTTKFPQAQIGVQRYKAWRVDKGLDKPATRYIGKRGSEGYGLTKEKQGHDPSQPNYVKSMDPRRKTEQDISSFLGVPHALEYDRTKFLEGKKLGKITEEYFKKSGDWKKRSKKEYDKVEKERDAFFKKHGINPDDFYKGVLSKYDSAHATKIKGLKEAARKKTNKLFDEYGKQPKGTRNLWATKKLDELNKQGYFDKNPFLTGFDWISKESYSRATKQKIVQEALRTGDWSAYRKAYGVGGKSQKYQDYQLAKKSGDWTSYNKKYGYKLSAKAVAYREAKKSGDWSAYRKAYGSKESPYKYKGKFFKSKESMQRYKEGEFWRKYASATPEKRRVLLAQNPKYNRRDDWTDSQWDKWKTNRKKQQTAKLRKKNGKFDWFLAANKKKSKEFQRAQIYRRGNKKIAYT